MGRCKGVMFTDEDGRDMPGRGGGNLALPLGRGDSISLPRQPAQRMKHGRESESGRTDTQMTCGMGAAAETRLTTIGEKHVR